MKEEILRLRKLGYSYKKIQKELNCSLSTISYHCQNNGLNIPLDNPKKISINDIDFIKKEFRNKTAKEISLILNISAAAVRKYGGQKNQEIFCVNCGNEMKGKYQRKFCSNKCGNEYLHKQSYNHFLEDNDKYCVGNYAPTRFKDFILLEQNNKCAICESDPIWMNKKLVFVLDHIDGDSSNNKRKNLRLICPNCNSQTDTFTSKNKNSARRNYFRKRIENKIRGEMAESGLLHQS